MNRAFPVPLRCHEYSRTMLSKHALYCKHDITLSPPPGGKGAAATLGAESFTDNLSWICHSEPAPLLASTRAGATYSRRPKRSSIPGRATHRASTSFEGISIQQDDQCLRPGRTLADSGREQNAQKNITGQIQLAHIRLGRFLAD